MSIRARANRLRASLNDLKLNQRERDLSERVGQELDEKQGDDQGVELSIDRLVLGAIRNPAVRLVTLVGPSGVGKTLTIKRCRDKCKDEHPNPFARWQEKALRDLDYQDPSQIQETARILRGESKQRYLVRGTEYEFEYIMHGYYKEVSTRTKLFGYYKKITNRQTLLQTLSSMPKRAEEKAAREIRAWASKLLEIALIRRKIEPLKQQDVTGTVRIEHSLNRDDLTNVLNSIVGEVGQKREIGFISLASFPIAKKKDIVHTADLRDVAIAYNSWSEDMLNKRASRHKKHIEFILAIFGATLGNVTINHAKEAAPDILDAASGVIGFFSPIGVVLVAGSALVSHLWEKKESSFGKYLKAYQSWNELPPKTRETLCEKLDRKYHLPPHSSHFFLSEWLGSKKKVNELIENLHDIDFKKLKRIVDSYEDLRASVVAVEGRLSKLERSLKETKKIAEEAKAIAQVALDEAKRVREVDWRDPSKLKMSWIYAGETSTLGDKDLALLCGLQSFAPEGREDKLPEFVAFGHIEKLSEKLSSTKGLFITGLSGSGKSRIIFEAIKIRQNRNCGVWVVGYVAGRESTPGTLNDLCRAIETSAKESGKAQVLVWDNFPQQLEYGVNLSVCGNVLEKLGNYQRERLEPIIVLDPDRYESMKEVAISKEGIEIIPTLDIQYSLLDLESLLRSLGSFYLGQEDYESKIRGKEHEIAELLYDNFNLPLAVKDFYHLLASNSGAEPIGVAKRVGSKAFLKFIENQFRQIDLIERLNPKMEISNIDLLCMIKLFVILDRKPVVSTVDNLQKEIFRTTSFSPLHSLKAYLDIDHGEYRMHSFYIGAIDFEDDTLKRIFDYMKSERHLRILFHPDREIYNSRTLITFIADHQGFFTPNEFIQALCIVINQYGISGTANGLAENFNKFDDPLKKELMKLAEGSDPSEWDYWAVEFGEGIGESFDKLADANKDEMMALAVRKGSFAYGFGRGSGMFFERLAEVSRKKIMAFVLENKEFARGFGEGADSSFGELSDGSKERIIALASESRIFASSFAESLGAYFDRLPEACVDKVIALATTSRDFATRLGQHTGYMFDGLSDLSKDKIIEVASRSKDFARSFADGLNAVEWKVSNDYSDMNAISVFDRLDDTYREKILALSAENNEFGTSFLKSADDLIKILNRTLDEAKKELVAKGDDFSSNLGQETGKVFDRLANKWKYSITKLLAVNEDFAEGFGVEAGDHFDKFAEIDKNRLLELVSRSQDFAFGFGRGAAVSIDKLTETWKVKIMELALESEEFATGLGWGEGIILGWQRKNGRDKFEDRGWVMEQALRNPNFAWGFGGGIGLRFYRFEENSKKKIIELALRRQDFAAGLGNVAAGIIDKLGPKDRTRFKQLANRSAAFSSSFRRSRQSLKRKALPRNRDLDIGRQQKSG